MILQSYLYCFPSPATLNHRNVDWIIQGTSGHSEDTINSFSSQEKKPNTAYMLGVEPMELLNLQGGELEALAEGPVEALKLWNLPRNKKRDQIKKVIELAKIVLG